MIFKYYLDPLVVGDFLIGFFFFWMGALFSGFYFTSSESKLEGRRLSAFGWSILVLALSTTSFALSQIFLQEKQRDFWSEAYWIFVVALPILFFRYSAFQLKLKSGYWQKAYPLISVIFFLGFILDHFYPNLFLTKNYFTYKVIFFGETIVNFYRIPGPGLLVYLLWTFINGLVIGAYWLYDLLKSLAKHRPPIVLTLAFFLMTFVFVLDLVNSYNQQGLKISHYVLFWFFPWGILPFLFLQTLKLFGEMMEVDQAYQKKSEELAKTKEEMEFLVGTISHDVKGPLLSVRGFTDLLRESQDTAQSRLNHYLERIHANVDHVRLLLKDLADYVRIGRVEERIEEINLAQEISQAIAILDLPHRFPYAHVKTSGEYPKFIGSAKQLRQIVINLIQNSLKYASRDDVNIRIETKIYEKGVLVKVSDNGRGIPDEIASKVFEKFFRHGNVSQSKGMGLSIVKRIAKSYGGDAWLEKQSKGACVCVYLPSLESNLFDQASNSEAHAA